MKLPPVPDDVDVVTVTGTVPAVPAGLVAVIWVELSGLKLSAGVEPNATPVTPLNPVPVIVTVVSPSVGPAFG